MRNHRGMMITSRLFIAAAAVSAAALLSACGGNNASQDNTAPGANSAAPAAGGGDRAGNPSAGTASAGAPAGSGADIFQKDCGRCHKIGAVGNGRIALDHIGAKKSQDWLEVQIRDPEKHHSRMPSFGVAQLPDKDLHTLSAYLEQQK